MNFEHEFFEDEVRDGFFVPAEIKHAWAAELEVLSEVDRICKSIILIIMQTGEHYWQL